jgi:adenylate cyclase
VLGDSVNLASRLESANKYFGTSIMISERTRELLDGQYLLRPIGRVRVVGKTEWVMTYEPLAQMSAATEQQKELAAATERIVGAFIGERFEACLAAAREAETRFGGHRLFTLYQTLSARYLSERPEGFDGVVALEEK